MKALVLVVILLSTLACSQQKSSKHVTVKDMVDAHKNSNDFHDWMESSYHPEQILNNKELSCEELNSLKEEELAIFYSALEAPHNNIDENCRLSLLEKIEAYYEGYVNTQKVKLSQSRQRVALPTRQVPVSSIGGPVFWYGERGGLKAKEVSLTFDDGPHPRLTPKLLNILDEYNVKATFFVLGKNARAYPEIIEEIVHRGHKLANHSHSHHNLPKYSYAHGVNEIEQGFEEILKITEEVQPFFRFPYGAKTSALQKYLKTTDTATFFWDVDTLDWKKTNPSQLLKYSTQQVYKYNNGIVLFHDVQPQTIAVMRDFIEELLINDYSFAQHVEH